MFALVEKNEAVLVSFSARFKMKREGREKRRREAETEDRVLVGAWRQSQSQSKWRMGGDGYWFLQAGLSAYAAKLDLTTGVIRRPTRPSHGVGTYSQSVPKRMPLVLHQRELRWARPGAWRQAWTECRRL